MTWYNWPAHVQINDPSGEIVYNTIINVRPPQPITTFTKAYKIPDTARTGVYTIVAVMTPPYPHYIIEEKLVIGTDGRTTLTITTVTETKTALIALCQTEFTVIDEFPTPQAFLGVALILGLLAFMRLTRRTKR
jgi:hypothetical protein